MSRKYYLTTTLPYVNAKPHIGFALEIIQADVLARYHKLCGDEVIFNTGTDEHGLKIYQKALAEKRDPQDYCDEYAAKFDALKSALNLSYNQFIRTTDKHHVKAAQEFWLRCFKNGDIYKKEYKVKYCVGCELEKTDSELIDGKCPVHPNLNLELIEEENYFFKFSKYQKPLLELYDKQADFVVPKNRLLEIRNFVAAGLQDFSVSRLKSKMSWGIEVPNDSDHVMYVWFDALVNYVSTLGWPKDEKNFKDFWPGIQVAGKDNLRQQSAMWQAMLMSAGLPNSKQVFIHGFVTSQGQKMSKSLGNVIDPIDMVAKYGTDAIRYYLLGAMPSYDDGDCTEEKFKEFYSANLANGIGNLNSRIMTMLEKYGWGQPDVGKNNFMFSWKNYEEVLKEFRFDLAVAQVNELIKQCDQTISTEKPWEKSKSGKDISGLLYELAEALRNIGLALLPIIPHTAEKILKQFGYKNFDKLNLEDEKEWGKLKSGIKVVKSEALFPRL